MLLKDRIRAFHLAHFSKPAENRPIYQELIRGNIHKILEVGIGSGDRSVRMIETALHFHQGRHVQYTGIDLFEARDLGGGGGLSLKLAHRLFARTQAKIRLVPGDAFSGIAQVANLLQGTDLIVISSCQDPGLLDQAWFYFPRMIHERTAVFLQRPSQAGENPAFDRISPLEIRAWAGRKRPLKAA